LGTISDNLRWYFSLRFKLLFSYITLSLVLLLVFYFIVMNAIETYHIESRVSELSVEAIVVANYVAGRHGFNNLEQETAQWTLQTTIVSRSNTLGLRILVLNDHAKVLADSNIGNSRVGQTMLRHDIISALNGTDTTDLNRDGYLLNLAVSAHDVNSDRTGVVLFVTSVEDIFRSMADIRTTLMLTTLLVSLLGVVLVFAISHFLIKPLRNTVGVVRRMATGQLSLRIPVTTRDEYAVLATAFNSMTEKLEQAEKPRLEFVSNVSHEMRTPLSAIKVLSESILLHDTAPEEMYREFLQDINQEVDRMTDIINDLLTLVKVDQQDREQTLNAERIELGQMVEDILTRLFPLADQKKIVLLYEAERPVEILADELKLTMAISNIVENGIKYTPGGGTIRVSIDSDFQNAIISIQDTGIGIPEEEHEKIFTRFYRVDKTRDRETGGTGLGLAISRSNVMLHGGTIRVKSHPDEGSIFTIRLPIRL